MDYLRFMKSDTLIIIDNFDILPETDNDLDDILELNCKIIFTTRNNFGDDYEIFKISEIDKSALLEIAEKLKVTDVDRETLDRIFEAVHNHTLACELILRLLKKSAFTADELLKKILNEHVGLDVSDKIRKDISATYYEHIHQLFRLFSLTAEQQETMRLLSLLPVEGIDDKYFKKLTGVKDMNIINELDEIGLVYHDEHIIRVHPLVGEAAAADFIPDMDNCREFTDNLILECRHHLPDEVNVMRQAVVLEICDRIVEFSAKNDIERYFYFLVNAYPYAETFEDEHRMKLYLAEMEKYQAEVRDRFMRAVYFMSRASFAMLFEKDCAAALKHTISAQRSIPEVVGGGFYSRQEIDICFNVNNNLGRFYLENGELKNSKKYLKKATDILKSCYKDGLPEDSVALFINLRKLEEVEVNNRILLELNGK